MILSRRLLLTLVPLGSLAGALVLVRAYAAPSDAPLLPSVLQGTVTLNGTFTLQQSDSGCVFNDAPSTSGRIAMVVDFARGSVSGQLLDGTGSGNTSGDMAWEQHYSATFVGGVNSLDGTLQNVNGTLSGRNNVTYSNCRKDNAAVTCSS